MYDNFILPYAPAALLTFPVGVNLLYATILFRHRAEIQPEKTETAPDPAVLKKAKATLDSAVSFLYRPFSRSCFWWEAVDSVRPDVCE